MLDLALECYPSGIFQMAFNRQQINCWIQGIIFLWFRHFYLQRIPWFCPSRHLQLFEQDLYQSSVICNRRLLSISNLYQLRFWLAIQGIAQAFSKLLGHVRRKVWKSRSKEWKRALLNWILSVPQSSFLKYKVIHQSTHQIHLKSKHKHICLLLQ